MKVLRTSMLEKILRILKLKRRIDFIGGSEALPPPLTKPEEAELIGRLASGDTGVRRTLIEHNIRLVVYIARRFENTATPLEDLVSIGSIGLIKAVNTFDANKNIKLATYASRCIENEILMYLRRSVRFKTELSFDEPLNVDWDGNELLLSDILGTEADTVYKEIEIGVERTMLKNAIERLADREQMIINMRFGLLGENEMTQKQVADELGISQSYISRLEKRIIKRLKRDINN